MPARKQPATAPQGRAEAASKGPAEKHFDTAGLRYQERLEALGVDPGSFLPEDDPRAAEVRKALAEYQAELAEASGPAQPDSLGSVLAYIEAELTSLGQLRTAGREAADSGAGVQEAHARLRNLDVAGYPPEPENPLDLNGAIAHLGNLRTWARGSKARPKATPPTFNPETGTLFLNGRSLSLEANEQDVLRALVSGGAMALQSLRRVSCDHPDRVLRGLQRKYPALKKHITLPGKKGMGGYSTTIRLAE